MENATKALLIAASVLIVILLIAMGVSIFTSTAGAEDELETSMTTTEIAMFNSKFTAYAGDNKSAAQAKALADIVIANNATTSLQKVSFNGSYNASEIIEKAANLSGSGTISVLTGINGLVCYVKTSDFSN